MKIILCTALLCVFTISSAALANGETNLSLNDAISIALQNNSRYRIAREKVKESDFKVSEAWSRLWPTLGSEVSKTSWNYEKGALAASDGQTEIQFVTGSLALNVGAFTANLAASREEYLLALEEERKIKAETIVNTIQLYYLVILCSDTVRLHNDSLKAFEENLRIVEAGYKAGSVTKLVYLRAQVAAGNEKTMQISAQRELESTKAKFNINLGREIHLPVQIDDGSLKLESGSDGELLTELEGDTSTLYCRFVDKALATRPELMMLQHRTAIYNNRESENDSARLWPTFFISGGYGMSRLTNPETNITTGNSDPTFDGVLNAVNSNFNPEGWNRNWNVTIGANYRWGSLSPLDPSRARDKQLKSLNEQTALEKAEFLRSIKLEIQDGLLTLQSAARSYLTQKENIVSAEESLRVAMLQFKNGLTDNTTLLNANVELSTARTLYSRSLFEFQSAKAKLNQSIGVDYFTF